MRPPSARRANAMTRKTIKVDYLARVEGEGAFKVVLRDGIVQSAELSIFEPPRFFEAFLRGRDFTEAPDITARICGICPVAYQMSAVHAMEKALGVDGRRAAARSAAAALLRRMDREPCAAHLHAARAGLPRLCRRRRHGPRPWRCGASRPGPEEGRKRHHDAGRRARDPPDQRARRRVLPHAAPPRVGGPGRNTEMGARGGARDRALDRRFRISRARTRLHLRGAAPRRRISLQRRAHRFEPRSRHRCRRL